MEWADEDTIKKERVRKETDKRLFTIALAVAVISILAFSSPLIFSAFDNFQFQEYNLLLTSENDSWFYGNIAIIYNDGAEQTVFILGGPKTESFPNGTTKVLNDYRLSIPREFRESTILTLSYNCTGLNSTIGPIIFRSEEVGLIYSDSNNNQMYWELR